MLFLAVLVVSSPAMSWTGDWLGYPYSQNMPASGSSYGYTYWYAYAHLASCAGRNFYAHWDPGFSWSGRGFFKTDFLVPNVNAASGVRLRYKKNRSDDNGGYSEMNQCTLDGWTGLFSSPVGNLADWNGARVDLNENWTTCMNECGSSPSAISVIHQYGDRWAYLNRWAILGPYSSTSLANTNGLDEANLYLYPYVETNKGTAIADGLWGGKTPEKYEPGDMNNAYSINFATKWNANPNQAGYAMAWVYSPNGAGPRFAMGSDDGCKVWLNGTNIHTNDIARGLTRDSDVTGGKSMPAGWNRVLFKIQQGPGGGGWQGTMSLRNGSDTNRNEPSVSLQSNEYGGYSVSNEQDGWYPKMSMTNFNGVSNPASGLTLYTNNTTVTASGTVTAQFIPFWKTGYYQWGRGLSGADENYKFTTNSGSSWSHTENNVTGYRRLHFFGISQSGRTSGQASGSSGGWTYNDTGNCAWAAVFVDNVAPNNPGFTGVNVVSPTQINVAWNIPLDKGVGVADGADESMNNVKTETCHYRRGDVGVNVRRNGASAYGWGTATSFSNTGLTPNTQYTFDIAARDNTSQSRGTWANATSYVNSTSVYTLSPAPVANSVTPDTATPCQGANVVWTNNLGWGAGGVQYFRYAWDKNPTHAWTDTETQWSSGALTLAPTSSGAWYLHVKSYNAENAANGAFSYSVEAIGAFSIGTITGGGGSACGSIDPGLMTYSGGSGGGTLSYQWYSKLGTSSPTISDTLIAGATGASYDPPAGLTNTTTYNVFVTPSCGVAAFTATPITATVNSLPNTPTNPTATPSTIGPGRSSALSATVGNGEEVVWYSESCGGAIATSPVSPTRTTTYYAKARNITTGCLSAQCAEVTVTYIPDDQAPVLANVLVTCSEVGGAPTYNFLKGVVTVEAEATDDSGVDIVEFYIDNSETTVSMSLDQNTGKYVGVCTIDEDWTNGQHSITVVATDVYGNDSNETRSFSVNKNEVSGLVGIEDSFVVMTRSVTFVLNGAITKTVPLKFINGKAYYSFTDVAEITSISAKTAWHLRSRRDVAMIKGQAEVDFLGPKVLRGGDLATPGSPAGDNSVNALDYAVLRNNWGYGTAGDINGDGFTDNNDYLILMKYLYTKGDLP